MTEVKFTFLITSAFFHWGNNHVTVGLQDYANRIVSDDELIEHINWQIEHETLHKLLYENFGFRICMLLDGEGFKLYRRINPEHFDRVEIINSKLGWIRREDDF